MISAEASATATAVPEGPQAAPVDVLGPIDEMEASLDMGPLCMHFSFGRGGDGFS